MSELTPCNYCSLQRMKRHAQETGTSLRVFVVPKGEDLEGWTAVQCENEKKPSAYFKELSDHCVC